MKHGRSAHRWSVDACVLLVEPGLGIITVAVGVGCTVTRGTVLVVFAGLLVARPHEIRQELGDEWP